MPIRFLHVADLHLGLRVTRFDEAACDRIGEARFVAIENLRRKATEHRVDFVLIAGDLFDDHSVSRGISERAFTLFEGRSMPCPVYLIPGNHDPLTPGGVWDREPWTREQPTKQTFVLRERTPIRVPNVPVTLYPCPLRHRNSFDDPTAWISQHPRQSDDHTHRIGLAHGSLAMLPNLPEDDHPIRPDAAQALGLDFLALGHWHKPMTCKAGDGAERTAYSGTHEPMRFTGAECATGWTSYASDGDAERFRDDGRGTAQLVTFQESGAPPKVETIEIGHLRWSSERRDLSSHSIGELFAEYTSRVECGQTLLRLHLHGVVDPEKQARIASLRDMIRGRFCLGSSVHDDEVLVELPADKLRQLAGAGVVARVVDRLREESQSPDVAVRCVANHALKELCRIVMEEQAS